MTLKQFLNEEDNLNRRGFMSGVCGSLLGVGVMPLFSRVAAAMDDDGVSLNPATARNVVHSLE